ncbi:MAG TPA: efflux RND transporter periplasmic adaptor subunit [Myxococcales bacterium]|nr:efflux RND transporter periplasmic adaptor subunit [Myxococcales bacterium]
MTTRICIAISLCVACAKAHALDAAAGAPPPAQVVSDVDLTLLSVDHPEQFPLATAAARESSPELIVTGVVAPDVNRNVPVVSMASGRVIAIYARVGDFVRKGQVLLRLRSDDVSGGVSDYRKAVTDEALARAQFERTKDLYEHGAAAKSDLEVAQNAEDKAKVDVQTKAEHLRLLGTAGDNESGFVSLAAPVSGVITDQQVTGAAGLQALGSTAFTISDLSRVWIVCDVYENDLPGVRMGDAAEVRLNAYPGQVLKGTIGNIGAVLDPNLRTAKVRIEVLNPGILRLGMFATATFLGQKKETHTVVPASAVLHLHDRDWVYLPAPKNRFRRVEVAAGRALDGSLQEIKSGLEPGQQLVADALVLDHAVEQ